MIPKKAKSLIPEVSKDLELDEELVKDVIDFYWDDVYDALRSIEHTRLYIQNLGDFNIKHWLLTKKILDYSEKLDRNPGQTFMQRLKKEEATESLDKMIKLQKDLSEEYSKKQTKKQLRNEFSRSKENLE
jgi:hypothetical protein